MASTHYRRDGGFSLIELMITLVILAILLSVALPSFRTYLLATQARHSRETLLNALALARSNAMTRTSHIVVCPRSNGTGCSGSVAWQTGWIVFQDNDGDNARGDTEPLLAAAPALPRGQAAHSSAGRTHITYRSDGSASGTNSTITFCDGRGAAQATSIVISNVGRARIGKPSADQASEACSSL